MQIIFNSCLTLLLSTVVVSAFAADEVTEPVVETPAETTLMRSEVGHVEGFVSLPFGDDAIDATYLADKTGRDYGKVLILPGRDGNIDSYDLVHTLRMNLAQAGWSTMTVALNYSYKPQILSSTQETVEAGVTAEQTETSDESSATQETTDLDENAARVTAAMTYLNAQQAGPVVVILMGKSAELSATAIAQAGDDNALIWISPDWASQQPPDSERVLDITPSILSNMSESKVQRRAVMMRKNIEDYSLRQINGATSGFYGFELPVFYLIRNWLHKKFVQGATR